MLQFGERITHITLSLLTTAVVVIVEEKVWSIDLKDKNSQIQKQEWQLTFNTLQASAQTRSCDVDKKVSEISVREAQNVDQIQFFLALRSTSLHKSNWAQKSLSAISNEYIHTYEWNQQKVVRWWEAML